LRRAIALRLAFNFQWGWSSGRVVGKAVRVEAADNASWTRAAPAAYHGRSNRITPTGELA